jgi:hypothetical protein
MNASLAPAAVVVRRVIAASAEDLFDAWLDPRALSVWLRLSVTQSTEPLSSDRWSISRSRDARARMFCSKSGLGMELVRRCARSAPAFWASSVNPNVAPVPWILCKTGRASSTQISAVKASNSSSERRKNMRFSSIMRVSETPVAFGIELIRTSLARAE